MSARTVDLRGAIVADVPRGRIETRDHRRLLALTTDWLETLIARAPSEATAQLGRGLGHALESDARAALDASGEPSPEDMAYALNVAFASRGLGTTSFEQWGDALVVVWTDPPGSDERWRDLGAAILAGAMSKLSGVELSATPIAFDRTTLRVLIGSESVCQYARERVQKGHGIGQILDGLDRGGES